MYESKWNINFKKDKLSVLFLRTGLRYAKTLVLNRKKSRLLSLYLNKVKKKSRIFFKGKFEIFSTCIYWLTLETIFYKMEKESNQKERLICWSKLVDSQKLFPALKHWQLLVGIICISYEHANEFMTCRYNKGMVLLNHGNLYAGFPKTWKLFQGFSKVKNWRKDELDFNKYLIDEAVQLFLVVSWISDFPSPFTKISWLGS